MHRFHISSRLSIHLLGLGTAVSLLGDATLYTVLPHPDIAAQVGVTLAMVGLLLGANRLARLVLNGPVGVLYDRLPRRGLLVTSLALGAFSSLFYALGYGFWPILFGRVLWGVAWSLIWVGGNSVVLDLSTEQDRGRNSGLYQMWFFIGVALASLAGALITDLVGFRTGQWISASVIGLMAIMWLIFLPESRKSDLDPPDRLRNLEKLSLRRLPWRVMLRAFLTVLVARFISWGVLASTAILWLSVLFGEKIIMGVIIIPIATLTGLFTALSNLTSIGSARLSGRISDRLHRRWPVIGVATLLGGVGLWLMSGSLLWLALLGGFLVPVAGSVVETLIPAIAGDRVMPELRGRALGLINTAGDFGAMIGPVIALSALNTGWVTLGEIYIVGGILFILVALAAMRSAGSE